MIPKPPIPLTKQWWEENKHNLKGFHFCQHTSDGQGDLYLDISQDAGTYIFSNREAAEAIRDALKGASYVS